MRVAPGEGVTLALGPMAMRVGDLTLSIVPDEAGVWALRVEAGAPVDVEPVVGHVEPSATAGDLHQVVSDRLRRASLLRGDDARTVTGHTSLQDVALAAVSLSVDLAWVLGRPTLSGIARPPSVELSTVGARVAATRRSRGMSTATLGRAAGITASTVERVERGEWMAVATIERLAKALSVHPYSLALPL